MHLSPRLAASIAIVAVLGVGGVIYANSGAPAASRSTATPTPTPAVPPALLPTDLAPESAAWTTYTSAIHGITLRHPSDWSVRAPATRSWGEPGDAFPADELPFADTFVGPGGADTAVGLAAWQMHIDVFVGAATLKALADKSCVDVGGPSCETFTQRAVPLEFDNGNRGGCALLVPTTKLQYAFLSDQESCLITEETSWITVLVVTREDDFPAAIRYGGSLELLRSIIATTNVWRPGQRPGA